MQAKDLIIKKTAEELGQPLDVVEIVISNAFKCLSEASKKYDQLEVSGFGLFSISPAKMRRRVQKCEKILGYLGDMPPSEDVTKKTISVTDTLNYYKERLEKYEQTV